MTGKSNNKVTGNRGEGLAVDYLEKKGYRIEECNFHTRFGEIDIVCWDGETLVFVEVKTKIGHDFGEPEEMVNKGKLAQVKRMGEVYIATASSRTRLGGCGDPRGVVKSSEAGIASVRSTEIRNDELRCRVDVVAVVLEPDGSVERIEHYQAVY